MLISPWNSARLGKGEQRVRCWDWSEWSGWIPRPVEKRGAFPGWGSGRPSRGNRPGSFRWKFPAVAGSTFAGRNRTPAQKGQSGQPSYILLENHGPRNSLKFAPAWIPTMPPPHGRARRESSGRLPCETAQGHRIQQTIIITSSKNKNVRSFTQITPLQTFEQFLSGVF